jgi:hypothetical protein
MGVQPAELQGVELQKACNGGVYASRCTLIRKRSRSGFRYFVA